MIGQPSGVCLFLTCDSTNTRIFSDDFRQFEKRGKDYYETKVNKSGIVLCSRHVKEIVAARHAGEMLCITREGWVYIDNWNWLLWDSEAGS